MSPTYFERYLAERLEEPAIRAGYEHAQRAPRRRLIIAAAVAVAVTIAALAALTLIGLENLE